ncbi:MAG: hypothetical protein EAZ57_07900 [Cytophagales bacterium]|nr:MAG: hypothetical protein EAZ67_08980 [Cytophagales bacterium]TAF60258.1 MAG: hypothetical protein EAZ57_07900 [Cytophagales bacterium]
MSAKNPYWHFLLSWLGLCLGFGLLHEYGLPELWRAHLHYPLQLFTLKLAHLLSTCVGIQAHTQGHVLILASGQYVSLGEPCSGLPMLLLNVFWLCTFPYLSKSERLYWILGSSLGIIFLNALRVCGLAYVQVQEVIWRGPDHHFWFNTLLLIALSAIWAYLAYFTVSRSSSEVHDMA